MAARTRHPAPFYDSRITAVQADSLMRDHVRLLYKEHGCAGGQFVVSACSWVLGSVVQERDSTRA